MTYDVFYFHGGVSIGNTATISPAGLVTLDTTSISGTLMPEDVDVVINAGGSAATVKLTNFKLNNQPLLGDTTHFDNPCGNG